MNGKLRGTLEVSVNLSNEEVQTRALELENVKRFIGDKSVKKVIVVPKRIVNIVVSA